jgi:hypothetical protein
MVAHKRLYHRFLDLAKVFYRHECFFSSSNLRNLAAGVKRFFTALESNGLVSDKPVQE